MHGARVAHSARLTITKGKRVSGALTQLFNFPFLLFFLFYTPGATYRKQQNKYIHIEYRIVPRGAMCKWWK